MSDLQLVDIELIYKSGNILNKNSNKNDNKMTFKKITRTIMFINKNIKIHKLETSYIAPNKNGKNISSTKQ